MRKLTLLVAAVFASTSLICEARTAVGETHLKPVNIQKIEPFWITALPAFIYKVTKTVYLPEQPRVYMDTTYSLPTGGTTHTPANSAALTTAFATCARGDVIVLDHTVTYVGTFTIPNLGGSGWVYVIPDSFAGLPAAGTRAVAADGANMPKITTAAAGNTNALVTVNSSNHFRFVCCEIKNTDALGGVTTTIAIGNSNTSHSTVPDNIVFDRCSIHGSGHATQAGRRGMSMNGTNIAVIDSHISGYWEDGADSQAILGTQGNGPFKIVNNYLEAVSENIMFGGTDPTIQNSVPQDLEIRHNHLKKLTAWKTVHTDVKNNLEFKNVRRALVEGNTLDGCWQSGQSGYGFLITPRNQSGTLPWCETSDITFRWNKFVNTGAGISMSGRDANPGFTTQITNRVLIENNLIIADGQVGDSVNSVGYGFSVGTGIQNLTIRYNTIIAYSWASFANASAGVVVFKHWGLIHTNNLYVAGTGTTFDDWSGDGTVGATNTLATYFISNWTFAGNVLVGGNSGSYPTGNFFPANTAAVDFVNYAGGDYTLNTTSAYHNASTDGIDIGCNISAMNGQTA